MIALAASVTKPSRVKQDVSRKNAESNKNGNCLRRPVQCITLVNPVCTGSTHLLKSWVTDFEQGSRKERSKSGELIPWQEKPRGIGRVSSRMKRTKTRNL